MQFGKYIEGKCSEVEIHRKTNRTVWLAGVGVAALVWVLIGREFSKADISFGDIIKRSMAEELSISICDNFIPLASFAGKDTSTSYLLEQQMADIMPFYAYTVELQEVLLAEGRESEGAGMMPDDEKEDNYQGEYAGVDNDGQTGNSENTGNGGVTGAGNTDISQNTELNSGTGTQEDSLDDLLQSENEAAMLAMMEQENGQAAQNPAFIPRTLQETILPEEYSEYEALVNRFYTIDQNTMAGSDQLNASLLAGKDLTIEKTDPGPQILIYHTHSQEGFADSVPGDESTTIIGVGEHLADILTENYGYQVLHHTGKYDVDSRDDAYSKALPAIEQVLAENPSIQVIIDLHRDQMAEETRLVMDVDGRPTARFMFFNGLSRTRKTGNISYLYNENQEDNLAFSFQMQLKAESYYPGLARKIYLKGYRYNMHLRPRTLLIELGAQNNTLEEVMNACDPIAHILDMVLSP